MLELEQALQRIVLAMPKPISENIPLGEAHGRVMAERVLSPIDLPSFDNSAMDGYAVRSTDVAAAKADCPVRLSVVGKVAAGESFGGELAAAGCVRLFTGSPLPAGADAVVMQEDTRVEGDIVGEILVLDKASPWENVRLRGEDVKRGAVLVEAGERLTSGRV